MEEDRTLEARHMQADIRLYDRRPASGWPLQRVVQLCKSRLCKPFLNRKAGHIVFSLAQRFDSERSIFNEEQRILPNVRQDLPNGTRKENLFPRVIVLRIRFSFALEMLECEARTIEYRGRVGKLGIVRCIEIHFWAFCTREEYIPQPRSFRRAHATISRPRFLPEQTDSTRAPLSLQSLSISDNVSVEPSLI